MIGPKKREARLLEQPGFWATWARRWRPNDLPMQPSAYERYSSMSTIPYPSLHDVNVAAEIDEEQYEQAYAAAVQRISPDDVAAEIDALAAELRGRGHPLHALISHYLKVGDPYTGRVPVAVEAVGLAYDALVRQALVNLIDRELRDGVLGEA